MLAAALQQAGVLKVSGALQAAIAQREDIGDGEASEVFADISL